MRLKGKVALVTGSATGIGEAIARRFALEGAQVMAHDRPDCADDGRKVSEAIRADGGDADFYPADLADPGQCASLVDSVVRRFGSIHILVNNAAVMIRSNLATTDADVFDRTIAVNLRAPLLLT